MGSLNEEVQSCPQIGWIRPDIYEQYYLVEEIYKLREKKEEIEKIIDVLNRKKSDFNFDKIENKLIVHGIHYDPIREIEGSGKVLVDVDKLFKEVEKNLECIKNLSEMRTILRKGINSVCGSCFDYIDKEDINKIINILCDTEYVRIVLNNGEDYFGLSVLGKEYSNIK